jgi:hypothetical protein
LQHAPPPLESDGLAPELSGDDGGSRSQPGGPTGDGPRGPWDGLDPGNLPDEYFAVAWRPEPCLDCWDESGLESGARIDVVDLEGQVIVEFERPFQDIGVAFERFEPAADGTLLIVERSHSLYYYLQPSDWERRVWRADAISGETHEILRMSHERVEMPQSGRSFEFPRWGEVRFAADPTNPDALWIVSEGGGQTAMTLIRVDLVDPDEEPVFHDLSGLPEAFGVAPDTYWASVPTALSVQRIGQEIEVILTVEGGLIYADPMTLPRGVFTFRPGDGTLEGVINLRGRTYLADVRFGAAGTSEDTRRAEGTALLQVGMPRSYCSEPNFAMVQAGSFADAGPLNRWDIDPNEQVPGVEPIQGDSDMSCVHLGPLLDESGPTFVYWGDRLRTDDLYRQPPSRIALSHRGRDVWSWDVLRIGLRETEFRLMGLERIVVP